MKCGVLILVIWVTGCATHRINDPCRQAIDCVSGRVQNELSPGQGYTRKTAEIQDVRQRRVGSVMSKY